MNILIWMAFASVALGGFVLGGSWGISIMSKAWVDIVPEYVEQGRAIVREGLFIAALLFILAGISIGVEVYG